MEDRARKVASGVPGAGRLDPRSYNVGGSDYSGMELQPYDMWRATPWLTSWDHDIIKRVMRTKKQLGMTKRESRIEDYRKIIHICEVRIADLERMEDNRKELEEIVAELQREEAGIRERLGGETGEKACEAAGGKPER